MKISLKKLIPVIAFAAAAALLAALPSMTAVRSDENKPSILSGTADRRTLVRSIYSGGPVSAPEAEQVSIPDGVEITEYLVNNGDMVTKDQPIARVDRVSVMTAVTEVQETLDTLNADIEQYWHTSLGVFTYDEEGNIYINGKEVDSYGLANAAELENYVKQHGDYEEIMLQLFRLYQDSAVHAPCDGMIDGLDKTLITKAAFSGGGQIKLLAANTPYGDDTNTYSNYVGIVTSVGSKGIEMLMNPTDYPVTDYRDLSGVDMTVANMTAPGTYTGSVPLFTDSGGSWTYSYSVNVGDILLFSYNAGTPVWVVKTGSSGASNPSAPSNPSTPSTPSTPSATGGNSAAPSGGGYGAMPSGGMSYGAMTSESEQESEGLFDTVGTGLCSVVPMDTMSITALVDEQDVSVLKSGQTATVTFDALPGQSFEAVITRISDVGDNEGGSSKFEFTLELPYSEGMLPGMNASVIMETGTVEDVLTVPVAAIFEQNGRSFVYTVFDSKHETLSAPLEIETGFSDGEYAELLSGLSEGQTFFYEYYDTIGNLIPGFPGGGNRN